MARIYLSYNHKDRQLATEIGHKLRDKFQHQISIDTDELTVGVNWRESLNTALKNSDGIVVLLSANSLNSQYLFTELGAARAYNEVEKKKFIIPIIIGKIDIPPIIQDLYCIYLNEDKIDETIDRVNHSIVVFLSQLEVEKEQKREQIEKIEQNASKYVEGAMNELKTREQRNKTIGTVWYNIGFVCLFIGVAFGLFNFVQTYRLVGQDWVDIVLIAIKSVVIIGLLLASSKYSFTLGKTYINESLKNADRLHAISFGKFYLDAYGRNANWQELKEAFQHWNIDKDSQFSKLTPTDFDPKFIEMIIELSKVVSEKTKK